MRKPKISLLIPVRDAHATLAACLRSVERQRETDWECVIVDDGSTDDGAELARRFQKRDRRFRIVAAPRRGLVAALNTGLAACRGRFVARFDADDLMHRERLAEQAALLGRRADWDGLGCHVRIFPRRGLGPGTRSYERWINAVRNARDVAREAFVECPLAHPTWMLRREALAGAGYRELGWPEDYDLLLRLLIDGRRLGVLPRRRLAWRHGRGSLSRVGASYRPARFTACKAHFLARSFLAAGDRYLLWGYGGTGRTLCRELLRLGKRPQRIVEVHPRRLGQRIHGAPVIAWRELRGGERLPLVVSVAGTPARTEIRGVLQGLGFVEGRDFVCAA